VFFVGFGGWAATAPIESAAIAPGTVSVESNRKTIQHLEGGIVREILVRDGDAVTAGQVLMRLDETQPGATLDILNARYDVAGAEFSRLAAERDGLKETIFPDWLTARRTDPAVATILENQRNIFAARRDAVTSQTAILQQRIAQLEEEIRGVEGRIAASARQSALIADELAGVRTLYEKGLMQKPRLLELERRAAEIDGTLASDRAAIARARQQIGEARLRISELRTTQVNEAAARIGELQGELLDLTERIRAATDVRGRTEIRAPQDGTVVGLSVHTPGGVIAPGERLLDIVPSGDRLIVEARVDPQDIDIVRAGLEARVRFTAFTQRNLVPVPGTVSWVSADHIADERTGTAYFLARIALAEDDPALGGNKLYPGMSAEVLIVTGSRTALEYMLQPLTDTLRRAFRES
jgi:HlyD family type I secretion membrane fusion protein